MSALLRWCLVVLALCTVLAHGQQTPGQHSETISIRGRAESLRIYGSRGGVPAVVFSGDGGWIHLAPHIAELLAARDFFVVGVDVRAYLSGFTAGGTALRAEDEPADFKVLADFAASGSSRKAIFVGVSEGAGLSILAAADPRARQSLDGVVALGVSNITELGWRWRDAVIYLTHGTPNEPTFNTATVAGRMREIPLAVIHSTHDEFVPLAEVQKIMAAADVPKKLWVIEASDHRFSDNLVQLDRSLLDAMAWVRANSAR
jgi:alpha-beta hydrolase superfamily lysophospholipase